MPAYEYTVKTNCKFCGKVFESFGLSKVCPACEADMENNFKRIKEHLENFPGDTAGDICSSLDIPLPVITFFMEEERLIMKQQQNKPVSHCEICNKVIRSGRYCFNCGVKATLSEMNHGEIHKEPEKNSSTKTSTKFHTLENRGKK